MTTMLDLPELLIDAGVNVRVLDGWDIPHKDGTYVWREDDGDPAGHMHHHTATAAYTPNRDKANGYAGLSIEGSERLYQEDYGDDSAEAVYCIANAYPAPISSGAGDYEVLVRVRDGVEVVGRQGPDTPGWYGNTHYWNTEYVLDGVGAYIDPKVWEMMLTVCRVQNGLMGWTENMHIGHYHHTRRKIDLRDGRYADADETIRELRSQMEGLPVDEATLRQIIREEVEGVMGGKPITMPDGSRTGNQGVVNSILWAVTHGSTMWEQLYKASLCGEEE